MFVEQGVRNSIQALGANCNNISYPKNVIGHVAIYQSIYCFLYADDPLLYSILILSSFPKTSTIDLQVAEHTTAYI